MIVQKAYGFKPRNGSKARSIGYSEISPTINAETGGGAAVMTLVFDEGQVTDPRHKDRLKWGGAMPFTHIERRKDSSDNT